jgi:hypothetical protein
VSFMARVNVTERRLTKCLGPMENLSELAKCAEKCRARYQSTIFKPSLAE